MNQTQAKPTLNRAILPRVVLRIVVIVCVASLVGWLLNHSLTNEKDGHPAGFGRGMIHGALMPCALPHLLFGKDVAIYAENNDGRSYKLGYTVGVNGCGAVFFGLFFWRVSRWRNRQR